MNNDFPLQELGSDKKNRSYILFMVIREKYTPHYRKEGIYVSLIYL